MKNPLAIRRRNKARVCNIRVSIATLTALLACNFVTVTHPGFSQQGPGIDTGSSTLPIKQITLFTSGVSYTERSGTVVGTAAVPLVFHTAQINDILKSMVLLDHGGKVQPATYTSRDPIGRTLQGFAVDVSDDLSQANLLGKLRGAKVSIQEAGKPSVEGQIIGVEDRVQADGTGKPVHNSFLNILTDNGLTAIRLDTDKTVKILDARLNGELRDALTTLAGSSDTNRRQVMLHFAGVGKRDVRVGYIMEAPIWKISYRLVLGEGSTAVNKPAAQKTYLQGWALVENTSDEDWKGVKLSLVSGRPVSFIQDLYQPLYVPRPEVGPDVVASPYPQTHDENLQTHVPVSRSPVAAQPRDLAKRDAEADRGDPGAPGASGAFRPYKSAPSSGGGTVVTGALSSTSVTAAAKGGKTGELFKYSISNPLNLARNQAAMIPVISQDINTDRLSIYNADSDPKFPLNALRIRNNTSLHLKGGPITIFDGGTYAGDARMEDVPPGDNRLVTYAVDLSMLCDRANPTEQKLETSLTIRHGVVIQKSRTVNEVVYTLKSRTDKPRTVLVEQSIEADYNLVEPPKPTEQTEDLLRFAVVVLPRQTKTFKVVTVNPQMEKVAIIDTPTPTVLAYMYRFSNSAKLRNKLSEVIRRRQAIRELNSQAAAKAAEMVSLTQDQERIRKNMLALDKSSALYRRYVSTLDHQENSFEMIKKDRAHLVNLTAVATNSLHTFYDTIGE